MTEPVFVISKRPGSSPNVFLAKSLVGPTSLPEAVPTSDRFPAMFVAATAYAAVRYVTQFRIATTVRHRLLVCTNPKKQDRPLLNALFERVVWPTSDERLLKKSALLEVISAPNRSDLFIGGAVLPASKMVVLRRGNLDSLVVPFSWFTSLPDGPKPNFGDLEAIDRGQTIRFGEYEAAADAILYEFDPEFRAAEKKRRIAEDRTFGGSLRRLRLQRGLSRAEFPGVSEKEIARIERGDVKKPHSETLAALSKTLGVSPEEIETY